MTVSLFVQIHLKPGTREKFLARVATHRQNVRSNEPYCQRFDVMTPDESDNQVCLYEVYDDADGLKAHGETPYFQEYRADTADMIIERTRILCTLME